MEQPITQNGKKRCTNCQQSCVDVCEQVKAKHKSLILQLNTFHKIEALKAYGNPCKDVETDGIENLFVEKETLVQPEPQKRIAKIFSVTDVPVVTQEKQQPTKFTDIDTLLAELEKDMPTKLIKKQLTLADHIIVLSKLIRRGASETLSLLKPESSDAARNNLDVTSQDLEKENNEFADLLKTASASEKSENEFLRLLMLVNQAVESTKRLGSKEPLINYLDDITHPLNSYQNEIQLLQHRLTQK